MSNTRILTACLLGCLAVSISCRSQTAPSAPSASIDGSWTGTYRVISCRGGMQACFGIRDSYRIQLALTETPAGVGGTISGDAPAGSIDGAIPASGEHDDNKLTLQGSQSYLSLPYRSGIEVRDWLTAVNAAGTSMSGRFHLTIQFRTNNVYPDIWEIEAEILSLTR